MAASFRPPTIRVPRFGVGTAEHACEMELLPTAFVRTVQWVQIAPASTTSASPIRASMVERARKFASVLFAIAASVHPVSLEPDAKHRPVAEAY